MWGEKGEECVRKLVFLGVNAIFWGLEMVFLVGCEHLCEAIGVCEGQWHIFWIEMVFPQ